MDSVSSVHLVVGVAWIHTGDIHPSRVPNTDPHRETRNAKRRLRSAARYRKVTARLFFVAIGIAKCIGRII